MARLTETYNLEALYPAVAAEWHPDNPCRPHQVPPYSNSSFLWEHIPDDHPHCPSHVWKARVNDRVRGTGCPFCVGQKVCASNNLEVLRPDLSAEWHPDNPLRPHQVSVGSGISALWEHIPDGHPHCPSHVWKARVADRVSGKGCPFCAGRRACASNNLEVLRPDLSAEWHPDNPCGPDTVTIGSGRRVKWCHSLVVDGQMVRHEWEARVANRTWGRGCAVCPPNGFRDDRPGAVYLLFHPVAQLVKVGITNCDPQGRNSQRFDYFASKGWELVRLWHYPHGLRVRHLEAAVHALLADRGGVYLTDQSAMPGETSGWTETLRVASVGTTTDVEQLISQLAETHLGDEADLPEAA